MNARRRWAAQLWILWPLWTPLAAQPPAAGSPLPPKQPPPIQPPPIQRPTAQQVAQRVASLTGPLEEEGLLSGNFALARGGQLLAQGCFGQAHYELGVPNGPDTRFCIASLSKPMTAVAVAHLVHQGRLDVDAPVSRWLEDFPRGDVITVRHLLGHLAGIPHRVTRPEQECVPRTAADMVELAKASDLLFEPGTDRQYSSAGYSVVARIIEIATGADYDRAMRDLVFAPLGMTATRHVQSRELLPQRAAPYHHGVDGGYENSPLQDLSFLVGGGSLYATIGDVLRFGIACQERSGLPAGVWAVLADDLGWGRRENVRWNGQTSGYGAFLDLHGRDQVVVAFVGNAGMGSAGVLRYAGPRLARGHPFELIQDPLTPEQAGPYLGSYTRKTARLTICLRNGVLRTDSGGRFYHRSGDRFFSLAYACEAVFERDDKGAVTALVYESGVGRTVFVRER
ncbi:MAG: serine hydrolase domain-containing protein [Planctomycetota bacterium]